MSLKNLPFWANASQKRKRIYSIIFIFLLSLIVLAVGSSITLSSEDAYNISNQLNQTLSENSANNTLTFYIFQNNFLICLLMFVPIVGAALGMFILFETGIALSAIAATQGFPTWLAFASLVVTPVFWLEFAAYSTAMATSIWLFRRIFQVSKLGGRELMLRELKWTAISIAACAGLLAVGAVVEVWLINFGNSLT
jgi:uncharacterized membrane protein SpoIIM required for sporulation